MFKNIIFDIGGVMVDFNPREYLMNRFASASMEEKVYRITFGSETWRRMDAGQVSRLEGSRIMLEQGKQAGCAFEVQEVLDTWESILRPRRRMVAMVKQLKKTGHNVYYLSNIAPDTFQLLMDRELGGLFDGGVASFEVGTCKPDPRIYNVLLSRYDLSPRKSLFIDDNLDNVRAAFDVGIFSLHMPARAGTLARTLASYNVRLK